MISFKFKSLVVLFLMIIPLCKVEANDNNNETPAKEERVYRIGYIEAGSLWALPSGWLPAVLNGCFPFFTTCRF